MYWCAQYTTLPVWWWSLNSTGILIKHISYFLVYMLEEQWTIQTKKWIITQVMSRTNKKKSWPSSNTKLNQVSSYKIELFVSLPPCSTREGTMCPHMSAHNHIVNITVWQQIDIMVSNYTGTIWYNPSLCTVNLIIVFHLLLWWGNEKRC